jgi:cystathionine beta-lyase/cystathionine gamma-synthase
MTKDDSQPQGFSTRAVHAGERQLNGPSFSPVTTPIYPSVGYTYGSSDELEAVLANEKEGHVYSARYSNPTTAVFENAIADLEGGEAAFAFASGMAAMHVALLAAGVKAGTHVVAAADVYGATYSLLQNLFGELGATIHFVDVLDEGAVETALAAHKPVALVAETISNPLLKVANLPRLADMAHAHGALFLVDNTFCSPYLCAPLSFGADMIIHSATKFIAGHGDVMAGVVVTTAAHRLRLLELNKLVGSSLGPFEAWLALRGLKTLPLRMRQQCANATAVAEWLSAQPQIAQVNYPNLPDHPQVELVHRLTHGRGAGGVLSFVIKEAGQKEVFRFMERLQLIQSATTLGDIYSLVLYPAMSSHRSLTPAERASIGIGDGLVRLSVGIEDLDDIMADLLQALA